MARWFRLYDDLVDDPKVQRLPDDLFKLLINLWCLASKNKGKLPPIDDLAYSLRADKSLVLASLEALQGHGLVDTFSNQHSTWLAPHAWHKRQYKSDNSTERVRRFRNVSGNGVETPPETDTEAETEQRQKKTNTLSAAPTARVQDEFSLTSEEATGPPATVNGHRHEPYPDEFENLWSEYRVIGSPNASKAEAFKRWKKLSVTDRGDCWTGLVRYAVWLADERKKRADYPAKHLTTFIGERSWEPFLEEH